jgi:hypothetical protein
LFDTKYQLLCRGKKGAILSGNSGNQVNPGAITSVLAASRLPKLLFTTHEEDDQVLYKDEKCT